MEICGGGTSIIETTEVETIHANDIFEMLKGEVDLLSIDVEGCDLDILKDIDFEKYRPKIIIAELTWDDEKNRYMYQGIVDFLCKNEYKLWFDNRYNGIFFDKRYAQITGCLI